MQLPHEKKGEQTVQPLPSFSVGLSSQLSFSSLQHDPDVICPLLSAMAGTFVQQGTRDKLSTIDNNTSANNFIVATNLLKKSDIPILSIFSVENLNYNAEHPILVSYLKFNLLD